MESKSVRLIGLTVDSMNSLLGGVRDVASEQVGAKLPDYFIGEHALRLWQRRVDQIAEDPSSASWVAKTAVCTKTGMAVGYCGFHGPPESGMVEVGYSVVPSFRRQGYATAMLASLLHLAATDPAVSVVRASISPDNGGSRATVARFGFVQVGDQWDDEDGLELVFEVAA